MAVLMAYVVQCNNCGKVLDPETGHVRTQARKVAAQMGWLVDPLGDFAIGHGRDYCPDCRPDRNEEG